uniref:Uncharacterized protein n=1 Tax=Timema shepardi TaxID=629360 RepID=A0A7R9G1C3_TIMSH|nr:unnamed protein product [Timema shepardi]
MSSTAQGAYYSSPTAYLVLTDSSQLTSDSQHLGHDGLFLLPATLLHSGGGSWSLAVFRHKIKCQRCLG